MDGDTFHIIFQKTNFEILEFFVDFVLLKCYCHKRVCQHGIEIVERRGERGGRETCFKVVYFKFELSAFFLFLSLSPFFIYLKGSEGHCTMYVCATELQQQLQQNKLPTLSPTRSQACGYHHPTNNYPFGRSKQVSRKKSFHIYKKIYIYLSAAATATSFSAT